MNTTAEFLKSFNLSDSDIEKIIYHFNPDELDYYILKTFKPSEKNIKSRWIPAFVLLDFIKENNPKININPNSLGRSLKRANILSRNNHCDIKKKTVAGYYVEAVNNIDHVKLYMYKTSKYKF